MTSRPDPLALPAVPPPAANDHPRRDRTLIVLFFAAIFLPLIGAIVNHSITTTRFENRNAAPWPPLPRNIDAFKRFPQAFEAAFADRFGGRDALIAMHHATKAVGFGVSPVSTVMIARDGWLYFLGEDGKSIDRDYRGVAPYPKDEPERVAAELKRRRDYLAELGIAYVVMIVPDKATIYPENLPRWVARLEPQTRLDRLYQALKAYPDVDVLDLRPALTAAKARERVYYKTDSHWNLAGATVGYEALSSLLKKRLTDFPAIPAERPPYAPGVDTYSGDLARLLGLHRFWREDDNAPLGKLLANAPARCSRPAAEPFPPGVSAPAVPTIVEGCDRPGYPTAIVYRDSMAIPLIPLLSENFRRVIYLSDRHFERALIEREKPSVIIDEMVERGMHSPAAFPL